VFCYYYYYYYYYHHHHHHHTHHRTFELRVRSLTTMPSIYLHDVVHKNREFFTF
jgi:hypothetical protein